MAVHSSSPRSALRHCLLSNGSTSVMVGASGAGFTHWREQAVTRWREDRTRESWGTYLLLRDEDSGAVWSATPQPYGDADTQATVHLLSQRARFNRHDHGIDATLDIAVAHDADIELRRLMLHNHDTVPRTLTVTSYCELVVGSEAGDNGHPAFSKLFVQTEWDAERALLVATRRRRANSAQEMWFAQGLHVDAPHDGGDATEHETDRARFIGRGHTLRDAVAMRPGAELTGTVGCVLDPVAALRRRITLAPGETIAVTLWTQAGETREGVVSLSTRMHAEAAAEHLLAGATRHADAERERLGIDEAQGQRFAHWLDALLTIDPTQRATPAQLALGHGGLPALWGKGISGDRPLLLVHVDDDAALVMAKEALLAQRKWRSRQFGVDVVLLNTSADAGVQTSIDALVAARNDETKAEDAGDVPLPKAEAFSLRDADIDDDLRNALATVARVVLGGVTSGADHSSTPQHDSPRVDGHPERSERSALYPSADAAASAASSEASPATIRATSRVAEARPNPDDALEFANGIGGFTDDGRSYQINLDGDRQTPAPWVNVIANPDFGCMVSADGGGYAWSQNSQQNPLTPWPNDPVSDTPHDVIYIRDEDSGALWSATPLPIRVPGTRYRITHGQGFTRFAHDAHGIDLELTVCVPVEGAVKLQRLRLANRSTDTRTLTVTGYVDWALGANGSTPAPYVHTSRDDATGALLARNAWRAEYSDRVAFFDLGGQQQSMSGDRGELLGAFGSVAQPAALLGDASLSGTVGAGLDPCGALQTRVELPPGTQIDLVVALGDAASDDDARALIDHARGLDIDAVLAASHAQWRDVFNAVQVRTPDRAMDIVLNTWLPYQALGCRLWARTAYYQSSGAFGFRDQLQDVMGMCVSRPDVARGQIVRASGRQYLPGDVQHWWQPPGGQGVRTRITDDRIWLAYVAMHYVRVTGDAGVLDEETPFITGKEIPDGHPEIFDKPTQLDETATVYEHAARGIDISMANGAHGLPLIGSGDWNDGFNMVGDEGKGESTWLAWFLIATINAFAPVAEARGDGERAARWRSHAEQLRKALEDAWDGAWYRRGYFDNGSPLGSKDSDECQIDTLAQSWSLIAGATDIERSKRAMESVDELLIDREHRVARLFTPPFDKSPQNPGYIKGYPPGVRENGGQYTHGSTWAVFAWAALGDGDRAGELFDILNPIRHADSAELAERYKVEPYVVAADVYSTAPHEGRGGWTWYTGSASWVYRAGLEAVLGFDLRGDQLRIAPCIPTAWPGFELTYRHRRGDSVTTYTIIVENPDGVSVGVATLELDGAVLAADGMIPLATDGGEHAVRIVLG